MWEAIASNQRRSTLLIICMGLLLGALGAAIGGSADPKNGIPFGLVIALVIWIVLWLTARIGGDAILLASAHARKIEKSDAPMLWNIVEEMTIASGLPKMPDVYVIDDATPNAFAVGRNPEVSAVAVTTGLLKRLNRDELQGVIGHEIGHVKNLDIRFMTLAAVMMGAIALLAEGFMRGLFYSGRGSRRGSSESGGNQLQLLLFVLAIVLAILAPIFAQMLYFACSRRREYLADASSARYTRFPEGLASALEKIARPGETPSEIQKNRVLAPLYIINPRQGMAAAGPFATHPPAEDRVRILRAMGQGAGFGDYDAAFRKVHGDGGHVIGAKTLGAADSVAARQASMMPEPEQQQETIERAREAVGVFDRLSGLKVIPCQCGLRIKLSANFSRQTFACPRCGQQHKFGQSNP